MSEKKGKPYHHGNLQNSLISAAIALMQEKGPNAFSLREVAKKAGVSHGAPYRHFKDKAALLSAIAQSGFRALTTRLVEIEAAYSNDPRQQMIESGVAYVELAVENPEITQLMFGGYISPEECSQTLADDSTDAFSSLVKIIENGRQVGIYRQEEARTLALAAWSMVHGLAMLIAGGQLSEMAGSREQVRGISMLVENLLLEGLLAK